MASKLMLALCLCFLFGNSVWAQITPRKIFKTPPPKRVSTGFSKKKAVKETVNDIQYIAKKNNDQLTRILFVFDDSQSMLGGWQSGTKIEIAKRILAELIDSVQYIPNLEVALRVYGHQKHYPPKDCNDTRLEVPFARNNARLIKEKLASLIPSGTTPIAMSLDACEKDFPDMTSRNVIILITDGLEECGGDPCEASLRLQRKGVILKPFVIGLGHIQNLKAFDCVGTVYDASNESTFRNVLNVIISQAVNNTTAQVNLLDETNKATETNVNMTFYDMQRHTVKYNFVHTMNAKGLPDTLRIDPDIFYRIQVHTIPPAFKDSVRLATGKHTIIPIPTPQGDLLLTYDSKSDYKNLQAIIRKANDPTTLHVQRFNATERYITGKYDVEVLSIPRLTIKDVEISQSQVTKVEIPQPGLGTFVSNSAGFGSLYIEDSDKLTWVYNLDKNYTRETLVLQPGKYRAVFRSKNAKESTYTVEKSFEIISGVSSSINLF